MTGNWTQFWHFSNSSTTAEDSGKCQWLGLGLNDEKSGTHWTLLNFQKIVDDWDLNYLREISTSLITTQLSKIYWWLRLAIIFERSATHWSPLKTQENVDDWDLDSPFMTPPASGHLPTNLWVTPSQSSALALAWKPSMDSTCVGKDNTVISMWNICGIFLQLGEHRSTVVK